MNSPEHDALDEYLASGKAPEPRHYQPIWAKIKAEGKCVIRIDASLFPRMRRAISKEKWMDKEWTSKNKVELIYTPSKDNKQRDVLIITCKLLITLSRNF